MSYLSLNIRNFSTG